MICSTNSVSLHCEGSGSTIRTMEYQWAIWNKSDDMILYQTAAWVQVGKIRFGDGIQVNWSHLGSIGVSRPRIMLAGSRAANPAMRSRIIDGLLATLHTIRTCNAMWCKQTLQHSGSHCKRVPREERTRETMGKCYITAGKNIAAGIFGRTRMRKDAEDYKRWKEDNMFNDNKIDDSAGPAEGSFRRLRSSWILYT